MYVSFVAPLMSPQAVPSVAQRRHWYANDVGLLLQVPFLAVSVLPSFTSGTRASILSKAAFCAALSFAFASKPS